MSDNDNKVQMSEMGFREVPEDYIFPVKIKDDPKILKSLKHSLKKDLRPSEIEDINRELNFRTEYCEYLNKHYLNDFELYNYPLRTYEGWVNKKGKYQDIIPIQKVPYKVKETPFDNMRDIAGCKETGIGFPEKQHVNYDKYFIITTAILNVFTMGCPNNVIAKEKFPHASLNQRKGASYPGDLLGSYNKRISQVQKSKDYAREKLIKNEHWHAQSIFYFNLKSMLNHCNFKPKMSSKKWHVRISNIHSSIEDQGFKNIPSLTIPITYSYEGVLHQMGKSRLTINPDHWDRAMKDQELKRARIEKKMQNHEKKLEKNKLKRDELHALIKEYEVSDNKNLVDDIINNNLTFPIFMLPKYEIDQLQLVLIKLNKETLTKLLKCLPKKSPQHIRDFRKKIVYLKDPSILFKALKKLKFFWIIFLFQKMKILGG